MSDWVSQSEITTRLGYKVLIAGLSEAGKTAVKRIFFLKQETKDVTHLSATINYERMSVKINETSVTIVDLGGQKIFLKRFLSNFSPFVFSSVKALIFLIDVANKTTRNNAVQYFSACVDKLKEFSPDAQIFVFLHKTDLIRQSPNYESIHEILMEEFQLNCYKRLPFFRTTIYRPETIIDSFGRIFELAMPELAMSDFVNQRTIGQIEELTEDDITIREPAAKIIEEPRKVVTPVQTTEAKSKIAGDPIVLERLQSLMRQAVTIDSSTTNGKFPPQSPFLSSAATEEMGGEPILTPVTKEIPVEELSLDETTIDSEQPIDSVSKQDIVPDNIRISHLIDFYGVTVEEATGIINSGFVDLFEMVTAASAIKITLILDVFLKYLPFIKSKGMNLEILNQDRLLELFLLVMNGKVRESNVFKSLIFAVEKPDLPIEEIVDKYIVKPKVKVAPLKEKKESTEVKQVILPIELESDLGIIILPDTNGIGFKAEIIGNNTLLTFFIQGHIVSTSKVSSTITADEIMYLLAFEMNLINLGFVEGGAVSINFAARIIHETLQQLREGNLKSSNEIDAVQTGPIIKLISHDLQPVRFILPMEIEVEEDYIRLLDSEDVAFKIGRIDEERFLLSFFQRGFPIGKKAFDASISIQQLNKILSEEMQLPIETGLAVDFATRFIHSILTTMIEQKTSISFDAIVQSQIEEDDGASDVLKHYLDLLDRD